MEPKHAASAAQREAESQDEVNDVAAEYAVNRSSPELMNFRNSVGLPSMAAGLCSL
jgi:hypothetical protein